MRIALMLWLLALLSLGGCKSFGGGDNLQTDSADKLYDSGRRSLEKGAFDRSERVFKAVNSRFPFGPISEKAQLGLAFAQFRLNKFDEAQATTDRFIKTYPTHPRVDYAYYLRGLINFQRDRGFFNSIIKGDDAHRDQAGTRQSFRDFSELLKRFPDSSYAPDARARMVYLRNTMAEYELGVARYYVRRGAFVGAISRCEYVIENYQGSPQSHEALALMLEAYEALGEKELAQDTRVVLKMNAADHPFLRGERRKEKSLTDYLWPFGDD